MDNTKNDNTDNENGNGNIRNIKKITTRDIIMCMEAMIITILLYSIVSLLSLLRCCQIDYTHNSSVTLSSWEKEMKKKKKKKRN